LDSDLTLLVLRLAFVGLAYLFLTQVVLTLRRDLAATALGAPHITTNIGRFAVVDSECPSVTVGQLLDLQPNTSLGRDPRNTIVLDDSFVSATHALVFVQDGRIWIRDLGSTNGTFLNHQPVHEAVPIVAGDIVEIGRVKFKLAD
jgi:hypothetical protein